MQQGAGRGGAPTSPQELYLAITLDRAERQADRHGLAGRRHGHRGGRGASTREAILREAIDPHLGMHAVPGAARWRAGSASRATRARKAREAGRARWSSAYLDTDASLAEINPLMVTGDGRRGGARRQDELRRQRPLPPHRHRGDARPRRGEPARGRGLASSTSTTSSSTARSAAWSTAPAWRWRRWTSSSSTAASRPTSSTSAARRQPGGGEERLPDPGLGPEREGGADQHLRRHRPHRPHRQRRGRRRIEELGGRQDAGGGAARGHQRRAGPARSCARRRSTSSSPSTWPTRREKVVRGAAQGSER